jgi:hypothetical protein
LAGFKVILQFTFLELSVLEFYIIPLKKWREPPLEKSFLQSALIHLLLYKRGQNVETKACTVFLAKDSPYGGHPLQGTASTELCFVQKKPPEHRGKWISQNLRESPTPSVVNGKPFVPHSEVPFGHSPPPFKVSLYTPALWSFYSFMHLTLSDSTAFSHVQCVSNSTSIFNNMFIWIFSSFVSVGHRDSNRALPFLLPAQEVKWDRRNVGQYGKVAASIL